MNKMQGIADFLGELVKHALELGCTDVIVVRAEHAFGWSTVRVFKDGVQVKILVDGRRVHGPDAERYLVDLADEFYRHVISQKMKRLGAGPTPLALLLPPMSESSAASSGATYNNWPVLPTADFDRILLMSGPLPPIGSGWLDSLAKPPPMPAPPIVQTVRIDIEIYGLAQLERVERAAARVKGACEGAADAMERVADAAERVAEADQDREISDLGRLAQVLYEGSDLQRAIYVEFKKGGASLPEIAAAFSEAFEAA